MLTQFRFENFKSWRDTGMIRMAPLTGIFGPNSSGKTAILQFLLMLKQTVESSDRNLVLNLGNERTYTNLGSSYDILHQHQLPSKIRFLLRWEPSKSFSNWQNSNYLKFMSSIEFDFNSINVEAFCYQYQGQFNDEHQIAKYGARRNILESKKQKYIVIEEPLFFEEDNFKWIEFPGSEEKRIFDFERKEGKIEWIEILDNKNNIEHEEDNESKEVIYTQLMKYYGFPPNAFLGWDSPSKIISNEYISRLFSSLVWEYEALLGQVYYLGPLREYPQRSYLWSGERPQDVGKKGEFIASALLASRKQGLNLEERVAYWLKQLGLIHDFQVQPIAENRRDYEIRVRRFANSPEVLITGVGFGISQILPVLVLCYYVPEGSIVILEQPEIHLHPSVQAGLADVFIDVIKTRNVQIILESHSEHLLRRLQRRIAEEHQGLTPADAALYFCSVDETGTSQLTPLELDTYGNINNWPQGFFGDEMGDLVAMTEAAMQRKMAEI